MLQMRNISVNQLNQYALLYSDIFTSSLNNQKAIFDSFKRGG